MFGHAAKILPGYKSEERQYAQVGWKEPIIGFTQIGISGMPELMEPKASLVKALKEFLASVSVEESPQQDVLSAQFAFHQGGRIFPQAHLKKQYRRSHDIFIYGSDSNRIQFILKASLEEAVATEIPRITLNGATMQNTINSTGLRTILMGKFRILNQPSSVLVVLENCCDDMIDKFQISGFREDLSGRGVKIAVILWSCIQHGKQIDSGLLAPFTTRLFVPGCREEKPWLESDRSNLDESDYSKSDDLKSEWNPNNNVEEFQNTDLPTAPGLGVNMDYFYTEVTTKPGPSKATTVIVGQSNDSQSVGASKHEIVNSSDSTLPSYKFPHCESISITNNVKQGFQPITQQPRMLQLGAQTVINPKAIEKELDKQWNKDEKENRGFCTKLADCCVEMLECL
ncbi:hypothetical protein Ocin01_13726 [Orchesella cincta]|uniref:Uncharacterized protein n=1 Tax=Orchesella cincta TaxID=48709 RepID=A0A1D2MIV4_ORCCI|nr:hypothetical protein Ocin01_13726 [Orchesella cincta]